MEFKKRYILFVLMIPIGYLTRDLIVQSEEELICPRCGYLQDSLLLHKTFIITNSYVKCDSCGFLYPMTVDSICGITYWKIDKQELNEYYKHYHK